MSAGLDRSVLTPKVIAKLATFQAAKPAAPTQESGARQEARDPYRRGEESADEAQRRLSGR